MRRARCAVDAARPGTERYGIEAAQLLESVAEDRRSLAVCLPTDHMPIATVPQTRSVSKQAPVQWHEQCNTIFVEVSDSTLSVTISASRVASAQKLHGEDLAAAMRALDTAASRLLYVLRRAREA